MPLISDELLRARQTHGPALLAFVTRLTHGDVYRAEDIVQETFVRAWRHAGVRGPDGGWSRSWLITVARNIFIDQLRAAESRPDEHYEEAFDAYARADDAIERMVDAREVRAALNALPERLRVTLDHIFLQELSVSEVADMLSVPRGTVKSRTFYGLRALRDELSTRGFVFTSSNREWS